MTPIDELPALRPGNLKHDGGEYDALSYWPTLHLRRLRGAGYIGQHGVGADVLAEAINDRRGTDLGVCDALEWWKREALRELDERQRVARVRRELRRARAAGCSTWWEYRSRLYWSRIGATSVHDYCRQVGWR